MGGELKEDLGGKEPMPDHVAQKPVDEAEKGRPATTSLALRAERLAKDIATGAVQGEQDIARRLMGEFQQVLAMQGKDVA